MKTTTVFLTLLLLIAGQSCKKGDSTFPDYQSAINAKYKALGWTLTADNGGAFVQTTGQKGWVQYYGNKDRAIYYYPRDGDYPGGAFGMLNYEMKKYETLGQDTFAYVASDAKEIVLSPTSTIHYNEITQVADKLPGIVITTPTAGVFVVSGPIYQEYVRLNRWTGKLGYPKTDEADTQKSGGRYNYFSNPGATIIWSPSTGAHGYWNRVDNLYSAAGYSVGWLGFPKSSCDPNVADNRQQVLFEGGTVNFKTVGTNTYCGGYINSGNQTAYANGTTNTNGTVICY